MFFFLTQYLQGVRGFSALQAGLAFLPMTRRHVRDGPRRAAARAARRRRAALLIGGLALAADRDGVAEPGLGRDAPTSRRSRVPLSLLGIGIGIAFTPLTAAGIAGVRPADAGAASGLSTSPSSSAARSGSAS